MPYVKRVAGSIVGAYAARQAFDTDLVAEDDPELIAFRSRDSISDADRVRRDIERDPALLALVRRTAKKEGIPERALLDEIQAEVMEVARQ